MSKFRIHRKRPDIIEHRIDTSYTETTINGDGVEVEVEHLDQLVIQCLRPTTPQVLSLSAKMMQMSRAMNPKDSSFDPAQYASAAMTLLEFVHDITGIKDEDDEEVTWASLSDAEREALMLQLPLADVLDLCNALMLAGRLDADKKKSSTPTSPRSTSEASVAAPSVPEE